MEPLFISELKPLLDAVAEQMDLYVPKKTGEHFVFSHYDPDAPGPVELNSIRACTPVKEFLLPLRELAATYPEPSKPEQIRPFAVFGLKECDLNSIAILDMVFAEEDFKDPLYLARREKMFIIASDCTEPGETCFCCLFEGKGYAEQGFDLNISKIEDGFIVEAGSPKGRSFIEAHKQLFADVPKALLEERSEKRKQVQEALEQINAHWKFDETPKEVVEASEDSPVYDEQATRCIECQACTRVCPTCHCFYLYDTKKADYFAKMKIWDSCMRFTYAAVAGGANPNKVLGDRLKHRLMHKFVHFVDRYGTSMCVGCGRCVDAEAGGIDLREVLRTLATESKVKAAR